MQRLGDFRIDRSYEGGYIIEDQALPPVDLCNELVHIALDAYLGTVAGVNAIMAKQEMFASLGGFALSGITAVLSAESVIASNVKKGVYNAEVGMRVAGIFGLAAVAAGANGVIAGGAIIGNATIAATSTFLYLALKANRRDLINNWQITGLACTLITAAAATLVNPEPAVALGVGAAITIGVYERHQARLSKMFS